MPTIYSRHSEDRIQVWYDAPTEEQAARQRRFLLLSSGGITGTTLVQFKYRIRNGEYRVARVIMDTPAQHEIAHMMGDIEMDAELWLKQWIIARIIKFLSEHPDAVSEMSKRTEDHANFQPDMTGPSPVELISTTFVLGSGDILERVALGERDVSGIQRPMRSRRMFGLHQRSFRYMFPGFDVPTLGHMVPKTFDEHLMDCDQMCAYRMLREKNPGNAHGCGVFEPQYVNQWLNQHGHPVGGLQDGLSPDDIQAHAEAHRYGHCAMDLSRSVVCFHLPDRRNRNTNFHTICYYTIGNHCQVVEDPGVVRQIMCNTERLLGKRDQTTATGASVEERNKGSKRARKYQQRWITEPADSKPTCGNEGHLLNYNHTEGEQAHDKAKEENVVVEELAGEDEEDEAKAHNGEKKWILPTWEEVDEYIHRFSQNDLNIIESKLDPGYWEGEDRRRVHFWICTDAENVEFLYQYMVRVRHVDPMNYAQSYAGICNAIRINNIRWCACPNLDTCLFLQQQMFPKEPIRGLSSLGGYGLVLLQRSMGTHHLLDHMSIYPTDLQVIQDDRYEWNVSKHIQETYRPAYSDPRTNREVQTHIPLAFRRRIDLVRSYTSMIRLIAKDRDQYPVHELTNIMRPFDCSNEQHRRLPVGTYVVRCPPVARHPQLQRLLPFLARRPGKTISLTHRLLRFCIQRELLAYEDIQWICACTGSHVLADGLQSTVEQVYAMCKHVDAPPEFDPKAVINQMVGMCQSVKVAHRGQRYVFADIQSLWALMLGMLTSDQLRHVKVLHHQGFQFHQSFDYYEMDSTGVATRKFHLQPVYQMIVENQAMVIFDTLRLIPIPKIVQVNIDAIEYEIEERGAPWEEVLRKEHVVDQDVYERAKETKDVLPLCTGMFHPETPKDESQAASYHYHYDRQYTQQSAHWGARLWIHRDEWESIGQDRDVKAPLMEQWKKAIQHVKDVDPAVFAREWFITWENGHGTGLIITGAAGTGKTHFVRHLETLARTRDLVTAKLAYTHAACCQLGEGAQTLSSFFGLDDCHHSARATLIQAANIMKTKGINYDVVFVDEISMIPLAIWEALYLFHRQHPHTRLVLVGDFYQLPPVEKGFDGGDNVDYWNRCDLLPQLLFDFETQTHGHWIEMTTCRRGEDKLMCEICLDPMGIVKRIHEDIELIKLLQPVDPKVPIWRFCAWRNVTRKAVNFYCGVRYRLQYPDRVHEFVHLPKEWSKSKRKPMEEYMAIPRNFPNHWKQLQSFDWAEGMECVCRCTMHFFDREQQERTTRGCVNNRRGILRQMDVSMGLYVVEWKDNPSESSQLSRVDFAFHFVPGFCSTVHMSQGESISEHFGVMEWEDMRKDSRMAYVALTRTTHSDLVHLIPATQNEPWGHSGYTDLTSWVLNNMYRLMRWHNKEPVPHWSFEETLAYWKGRVKQAVETHVALSCVRCKQRTDIPSPLVTFSPDLKELCCKICVSKPKTNNICPDPASEAQQQEQNAEQ